MTGPVIETYRKALDHALNDLTMLLKEAQDYLGSNYNLAAIGTLTIFDEKAEDVKAALRLYTNALRHERRQS